MPLKDTVVPPGGRLTPNGEEMTTQWSIFFQNLQKKNVLGPTAKLSPTATNAEIAAKINELIQLLRDNKFIDDDTSGDP